jgi:hypothetical protein
VRNSLGLPIFKSAAIAAVALPLLSVSSAGAKPVQLSIQPNATQIAGMDHGSEIVISRTATSEVWLQIPAPDDKNRIPISFMFINKSDKPINVGPEVFSTEGVAIIPYEKLIAEQGSRESVRNFGHALANIGRFLVANEAGTSTSSYSFSGSTNYGGFFSGSGSVTSVDPYVRQRALEQAAEESAGRRNQMDQTFANARNMIAANLRTTTVMPNQRMAGVLTFELPHSLRNASSSARISVAITMGADRHVLTGFAGPFGTVPTVTPSPELAVLLAPRHAPPPATLAQSNTAVASVPSVASPASPTPPSRRTLAINTQSDPVQTTSTRATPTNQVVTYRHPPAARSEDWGLVQVPSQVGF